MKKIIFLSLMCTLFITSSAMNEGKERASIDGNLPQQNDVVETVTIMVPPAANLGAYLELTYGATGVAYGVSREKFSTPTYRELPIGRYTVTKVSIEGCDNGTRSANFYSGPAAVKLYVGDVITITAGGTVTFNCQ